jgi:hypothetical protein
MSSKSMNTWLGLAAELLRRGVVQVESPISQRVLLRQVPRVLEMAHTRSNLAVRIVIVQQARELRALGATRHRPM